jgi:hypothetical protein
MEEDAVRSMTRNMHHSECPDLLFDARAVPLPSYNSYFFLPLALALPLVFFFAGLLAIASLSC